MREGEKLNSSLVTRKKKGTSADALPFYAALHSTNFGLCLAAGVLSPRYEASAAIDHHRLTGSRILITQSPVSSVWLAAARGGIQYGQIVLAEIDAAVTIEKTKNKGVWQIVAPLPFSWVKRVVFRTIEDKDEFVMRLGGYVDVPPNVVEFTTDASLFGHEEPFQKNVGITSRSDDIFSSEDDLKIVDRIAGALASGFDVARKYPCDQVLVDSILLACQAASEAGNAQHLFNSLSASLEPNGVSKLTQITIRVLSNQDRNTVINTDQFLDSISDVLLWDGEMVDEEIKKFKLHAGDVIGLRREIAVDAFSDIPGKIIPRAVLLFLLNPSVEKITAAARPGKIVGGKVLLLAAMLAGYLSGLMKLTAQIKAPSRAQFLVTGVLSTSILLRKPIEVERTVLWNAEGSRVLDISVDGIVFSRVESSVSVSMKKVYEIAEKLQMSPKFDATTGRLNLSVPSLEKFGDVIVCESYAPVLPKLQSIEVSVNIVKKIPAKELVKIAEEINKSVRNTTVFSEFYSLDKTRSLRFFIFCLADTISEETLTLAFHALERQLSKFPTMMSA